MSLSPATLDQARTHLRRADPVLRRVIDRTGPCTMRKGRRHFQSLARAIVAQQISSKAAKSIWGRLQDLLRPGPVNAASIANLSVEQLRSVGISPQKAAYLHDLAAHVSRGSLQLHRLSRYPDELVIERLIAVKGIGEWTAQMFLMFSLGRLDVFPHGDLGIRTAIRNLYDLPDLPDRMTCQPLVEVWRPYSTIACWYLWRSIEDDDTW
ncbi:MAG: DNA-3-methyladenine glycosylase 2 family protein [Planctomycetaceae bacterium]|nr:DNA-3-methyladenine glycosylase 2 family protein [Planctomycetaceae bacterium]